MGKYGIGARVRDDDGDEGVIVDKRKGERKVRYDQITWAGSAELWMCKSDLTPIAANDDAPATQEREGEPEGRFKVGDRVRCSDKSTPGEGVVAFVNGRNEDYLVEFKGWGEGHTGVLSGKSFDRDDYWWCDAKTLTHLTLLTPTPEWQPKVGDRVRFKERYGTALAGDEGEVIGFWDANDDPIGGAEVSANDKIYHCYTSRIEPLPVAAEAQPAAAKWQPKAGDRVRMLRDGKSTTGATGKLATIEAYCGGDLTNQGDYLLNIDGPVDYTTLAVDKQYTRTKLEWIEPVDLEEDVRSIFDEIEEWIAANQPLTIEAGKSYKTRDGRKVGPIRKGEGWQRDWESLGNEFEPDYLTAWCKDGRFYAGKEHDFDLVAEWVEPVEPAPAAKFKVGDRVKVKEGYLKGVVTTRNSHGGMSFIADGDKLPGPEFWYDSELEPDPLPTPTIGDRVTLATPGTITGHNGPNVSVALPQGSFDLPAAALVQA